MFRIIKVAAIGAAIAALGIGMGGSASAMNANDTVTKGHYTQTTWALSCRGNVAGQEGGFLSNRVAGHETRSAAELMETFTIGTRIFAQRQVDGVYRTVAVSGVFLGHLGSAHSNGTTNVAPFVWPGGAPSETSPRLHIHVSTDGTYRLVTVTWDYNADGLLVAKLATTQGACTIA